MVGTVGAVGAGASAGAPAGAGAKLTLIVQSALPSPLRRPLIATDLTVRPKSGMTRVPAARRR
jgi:hypothetical protein